MRVAIRWLPRFALWGLAILGTSQLSPWNALTAQNTASPQGLLAEIRQSTDLAWLQRITMEPAFAAQLPVISAGVGAASEYRREAYIRLGRLGTAASLAAIGTIEAAMATHRIVTDTVSVDEWPREENGSGKGLAESLGPDGKTYKVVFWNLQGGHDLFLTSSDNPGDRDSWSRPLPIGATVDWPPPAVTMTWQGRDRLRLRYTMRSQRTREQSLSLAALRRDTDADGWTDEEERRLGLDLRRSDSDTDGIPDGADTCPLLSKSATTEERAAAIQRVFLAEFGFSSQRQALWITSDPVHVFGYGAPVLFGYTRPVGFAGGGGGATYVSWKVSQSADDMHIEIDAWHNPRAGYGRRYLLKRFNDQWFVVDTDGFFVA